MACAGGALLAWLALRSHRSKVAPPPEPARGGKGRRVSFSDVQGDITPSAASDGAGDASMTLAAVAAAPVASFLDSGRQPPADAGVGVPCETPQTIDGARDTVPDAAAEDSLPRSPARGGKGRRVSFSDIQGDITRMAAGDGARDAAGTSTAAAAPVSSFLDSGRQPPAEAGEGVPCEIPRTVDGAGDTAPDSAAAGAGAAEAGRQAPAQVGGISGVGDVSSGEEEYEVWSKEQTDVYTSVGGRGSPPPPFPGAQGSTADPRDASRPMMIQHLKFEITIPE